LVAEEEKIREGRYTNIKLVCSKKNGYRRKEDEGEGRKKV
jgi:hypothetical protein